MGQQTPAPTEHKAPVGMASVFLSFAPWIIFGVVASPSTWEFAALAALIASVVLSGQDLLAGRIRVLDIAAIAFFAVLSILALILDRGQLADLEKYAQVVSNGLVAVVAIGSLLVDPFTTPYARESTPSSIWNTRGFKHVNRVITAVWGLAFALMTLFSWLAVKYPSQSDWLNWVIPVTLLVLAVRFTRAYPAAYRAGHH